MTRRRRIGLIILTVSLLMLLLAGLVICVIRVMEGNRLWLIGVFLLVGALLSFEYFGRRLLKEISKERKSGRNQLDQ